MIVSRSLVCQDLADQSDAEVGGSGWNLAEVTFMFTFIIIVLFLLKVINLQTLRKWSDWAAGNIENTLRKEDNWRSWSHLNMTNHLYK